MTIQELFDYVQEVKPHQYEDHIMLVWLNDIEKRIYEFLNEFKDSPFIVDNEEAGFTPHTDLTEDLFVDEVDLYRYWLAAKIDFANYEFAYYNNDVLLFNALWEEFQANWGRTHTPLNHEKYIKI